MFENGPMGGKSAYSTEDLGCDKLLLVNERYLVRRGAAMLGRLNNLRSTQYELKHAVARRRL
ncbi:hypothetical protein [Sessilibacter corallicola]|uniref:hypothetical protein n=1 Tax=Sessilibacter corallicola TaxID=2904075 RepID=UPI00333ECFF8